MLPLQLSAEDFVHYPPEGRAFAVAHLTVLRAMPLALAPIVLREVIDYDWRFPVEQEQLSAQFHYLETLSPAARDRLMAAFRAVRLPAAMADIDWINQPQRFSEQLSASLWSMQEMDAYREAALRYQTTINGAIGEQLPPIPRFTLVAVGQGVTSTDLQLFRQLRPHGVLFTAVDPKDGLPTLTRFVGARAVAHPIPHGHWYIEGGQAMSGCGPSEGVTLVSFFGLASAAMKELELTNKFVTSAGKSKAVGPEEVQSFMAALRPEDLGLLGRRDEAVQRHFEVSVITQGAGAQVFSTSFVQWSAREALRRAEPVTLLARFAPRQRMAPMEELLRQNPTTQPTDPEGSLLDADMAAYYTWINQGRLPGAAQARFLAWFENHNLAIAIAPALPANTVSDAPATIAKILDWMT